MSGPLAGFKIVDVCTFITGPYATMILGDQGADVTKVEPMGTGDRFRYGGNYSGGMAAHFVNGNRSKRSIALDLKQPEGLEIVEELVRGADVFIQNFRPGTAERMGLGEARLRELRPDLIYASISGFGEKGPFAESRVYDPLIQAMGGVMGLQGRGGPPEPMRTILPDKLTSVTAAQAVTAALLSRERTGKGQHVRLSMLAAIVAWMWPDAGLLTWPDGGDADASPISSILQLCYETRDGHIAVLVVSDDEWEGLCRGFGCLDWLEDERFRSVDGRLANSEVLDEMMSIELKRETTDTWVERLQGEQVPAAPVLTMEQMVDHPQVRASEILVETQHPHAGRMRQARNAARFDGTPAVSERHAPKLGEHTDEILAELGRSAEKIAELRAAGTVQ